MLTRIKNIVTIQPDGYPHWRALEDLGRLLQCSLESLGCQTPTHSYPCGASQPANFYGDGGTSIVLGYHLLSWLAPGQIVFQTEQLSDREGWWNSGHEAILRSARAVWDYAPENVTFLKARGIDAQLVPLGFHPAMQTIVHRPEAEKDVDVLFYGSINKRRARVLAEIDRRGMRLKQLFGVYGAERDGWIARSRIVLNVHFYETQILEQVRLAHLLNNRCFVISEGGIHRTPGDWHGTMAEGVVTCLYEDIPGICETFLKDTAMRDQAAVDGFEWFQSRPMAEYLKPALAALGKEALCPA